MALGEFAINIANSLITRHTKSKQELGHACKDRD